MGASSEKDYLPARCLEMRTANVGRKRWEQHAIEVSVGSHFLEEFASVIPNDVMTREA